jgi:hypothetical protein
MSNATYDRDFYAWANEQAALLRAGKLNEADVQNIAEEIESLGRSEKREIKSRLAVLLLHLLKWRFQPDKRSASWEESIRTQRRELPLVLADNPSLKSQWPEFTAYAYRSARRDAAVETNLPFSRFPAECPWTLEQAIDDDFWPEEGVR